MNVENQHRRVIKIGGSLFREPAFPHRLQQWMAQDDRQTQTVLMAGGGPLADAVRELDQIHDLDETFCHWLCVDILSLSSRLLAHWLPHVEHVDTWSEISVWKEGPIIFDPQPWIREQLQDGEKSWRVTSDSIAALVAIELGADELVLFKSPGIEIPDSLEQAVRRDVIDEFMLCLSGRLPKLTVVQLSSAEPLLSRVRC